MSTGIPSAAPTQVGRFEYDLLRIATAVLEDSALPSAIQSLIANRTNRPECLSAQALALLEDRLAKGVSRFFARRGWQKESFLRNEEISKGSVWERSQPIQLGLEFGEGSLHFLMDLRSKDLNGITGWRRSPPLTLGDRVLILLCARAMNRDIRSMKLWSSKVIAGDGLIALMFPETFTEIADCSPDFGPWFQGTGPALLECMQTELSERWLNIERKKSAIHDVNEIQRIGRAQQEAVNALISTAEHHQRWDLCVFLLKSIQSIVAEKRTMSDWVDHINMGSIRLSDRSTTYDLATTLLRAGTRLQKWHLESQRIGYFDEGYQAAQLWKSYWEEYDAERSVATANTILSDLKF